MQFCSTVFKRLKGKDYYQSPLILSAFNGPPGHFGKDQIRSGHCGENKNLDCAGIEFLSAGHPARIAVTAD